MPPAARLTDMHSCRLVTLGVTPGVTSDNAPGAPIPHVGGPVIGPGAPTVLIGGLPAARVGDSAICATCVTGITNIEQPDVIIKGSATVMIAGLPAARMGDATSRGGCIVAGLSTVMIGG